MNAVDQASREALTRTCEQLTDDLRRTTMLLRAAERERDRYRAQATTLNEVCHHLIEANRLTREAASAATGACDRVTAGLAAYVAFDPDRAL